MKMKRAFCVALALALFGTTAASAHGWYSGGFGGDYRYHHGGDGAALGIGLGLLTLGVIAAESGRHQYRYGDGYDNGYYDGYGYDDNYYNRYDDGYYDGNRYDDDDYDRDYTRGGDWDGYRGGDDDD